MDAAHAFDQMAEVVHFSSSPGGEVQLIVVQITDGEWWVIRREGPGRDTLNATRYTRNDLIALLASG